ncbi:NepR family anti-sigma factor [Blastomonas sp. UPD001]|jgi:hypothetical protein|uniref:NepR family anti-sigma factor n=1 Tax=unclassified Blastomonas TaxID=2626550 RepID=UPI0004CF62E2|nr:NepR family anti-sigma factor [Blastomonas sp. UPD001]MBL0965853.1 hypothetical protein [Blastomonas sp.]
MLVHRDNDDQSGGDKPVKGRTGTKPHLVSENPEPGGSLSADQQGGDDGKSHLIGDALKSVYQRTLEEEIPDDFLDLLKQLK